MRYAPRAPGHQWLGVCPRCRPAMPADPAPLVSIIIPCYITSPRQAELLEETLHTVAAQTCRDYEIVVVDDGSPLDIRAITGQHAATVTLRQANAGSAVARNTGIRASRGRYLVFLDADDHLLPPALEAGLRCFAEHPECGFVVGRREEMTYEGGPVAWSVPAAPREMQLYYTLLAFHWYIIPPSAAMFRREVVEDVGGFRDPWGPTTSTSICGSPGGILAGATRTRPSRATGVTAPAPRATGSACCAASVRSTRANGRWCEGTQPARKRSAAGWRS